MPHRSGEQLSGVSLRTRSLTTKRKLKPRGTAELELAAALSLSLDLWLSWCLLWWWCWWLGLEDDDLD